MSYRILVLLTSILLTGCFSPYHNAMPDNYTGSISNIEDTMLFHDNGKSDFFYVSHVNNKRILDSRDKSISSPQPFGIKMYAQTINRDVPSEVLNLTIVGRTGYAAPILAMTGKEYRVKGNIRLHAEPNHKYIVKGTLGENYSAVWLEDKTTKSIIGNKIEINESAEIGFFD